MKKIFMSIFIVFCIWSFSFAQFSKDSLISQINATRDLREKIISDPLRPIYHFTLPEGMARPFDPNGAIYYKEKYHLGYIYQKYLDSGEIQHVWGHAVSKDLFNWTLYPDMLEVHENNPENGIFSGGAFLGKNGLPVIVYNARGAGGNGIAYAEDENLIKWKKLPENPVIKVPLRNDPLFGKLSIGDPDGWYEDGYYYVLSGGKKASFLKSTDLKNWEFIGDFIDQNNRMREDYEDISCADFFKISEEHNKYMIVFISHQHGPQYYIGDYENEQFVNYIHGRLNWPGGTFFAPEQLQDDKGRNIIWAWVKDLRTMVHKKEDLQFIATEWSGTLSLPRVLSLDEDGSLLINPPEEVKILRIDSTIIKDLKLDPGEIKNLTGIQGRALEIKLEIENPQNEGFGLKVLSSPDGREETIIKYDKMNQELVIDFKNSSLNKDIKAIKLATPAFWFDEDIIPSEYLGYTTEQRAPFALKPGENLELDIFIDHSIIEVFVNSRICVTQRVYPTLPNSIGISVFNDDQTKPLKMNHFKVWQMSETSFY